MAFWNRKNKANTTPTIVDEEVMLKGDFASPISCQASIEKHARVGRTSFTDEGLTMGDNTSLLDFDCLDLTPEDIAQVADYIQGIESPTRIEISRSTLPDDIQPLTDAIGQNPNIKKLRLYKTPINDNCALALADCLTENPALYSFILDVDPEALSQNIKTAYNHAIASNIPDRATAFFSPTEILDDEAKAVIQRNHEIGDSVATLLCNPLKNAVCSGNLAVGAHGLLSHTMGGIKTANKANLVLQFLDVINEQIPHPTVDEITSLNDLRSLTLSNQDLGILNIDNPHFWDIFPEVAAKLEKAGTPITKKLLMQPNPDGDPTICNAIHAGKLGDVVAHLNSRGERITAEDITPEISEALARTTQAGELFCEENLKTKQEIKALRDVMPNFLSFEPTNLHALTAKMGRHEAENGRV